MLEAWPPGYLMRQLLILPTLYKGRNRIIKVNNLQKNTQLVSDRAWIWSITDHTFQQACTLYFTQAYLHTVLFAFFLSISHLLLWPPNLSPLHPTPSLHPKDTLLEKHNQPSAPFRIHPSQFSCCLPCLNYKLWSSYYPGFPRNVLSALNTH